MANLQLIKTLAEKKNISLVSLAQEVGISEQQIHLMCRTNSTKITTLEKIASVLGVPITYFFDDSGTAMKFITANGDHAKAGERFEDIYLDASSASGDSTADLAAENESLRRQLIAAQQKIISLLENNIK